MASSDWYTPGGTPATGASGSSADMRGELALIETALDKLPTLTGKGSQVVRVNSGGTALEPATSLTLTGVMTAATLEATGDTSAGDNAAMGYTATEGLILTGQGSTNDITIKNDADAVVLQVATGTQVVDLPGSLKLASGATVTAILDEDAMGSNSDTALVTQQSLVAYVATQLATQDALSEVLANGNTSGSNNLIIDNSQILTTDTINETTVASGVTIEGILHKDSQITSAALITVDNVTLDGNTITADTGDLNLTSTSGNVVLDGAITVAAGVVTGATSVTSTAFVGDLTGNASGTAATVTGPAQTAITSVGTLTSLTSSGDIQGTNFIATGDTASDDLANVGYNAIDGLILTGQGSTGDVTIKNDADTNVIWVPTGTSDFSFAGLVNPGTTTGITAGTTQTQGGATALTTHFNIIGTCATFGNGVKLPTAVAGLEVTILNEGAAAAKVWPDSSDQIESQSANTYDLAYLGVNATRRYRAVSASKWIRESVNQDQVIVNSFSGSTSSQVTWKNVQMLTDVPRGSYIVQIVLDWSQDDDNTDIELRFRCDGNLYLGMLGHTVDKNAAAPPFDQYTAVGTGGPPTTVTTKSAFVVGTQYWTGSDSNIMTLDLSSTSTGGAQTMLYGKMESGTEIDLDVEFRCTTDTYGDNLNLNSNSMAMATRCQIY